MKESLFLGGTTLVALFALTPLLALEQTDVKLVTAEQTVSLQLDARCTPVGKAKKLVPVVEGFFNVTPVNEALYRKTAVAASANTVQVLFEFTATQNYQSSVVRYAYVRFWSCP